MLHVNFVQISTGPSCVHESLSDLLFNKSPISQLPTIAADGIKLQGHELCQMYIIKQVPAGRKRLFVSKLCHICSERRLNL